MYVLPGGGTSKHKMARVLGAFGVFPAALVVKAFDKAESVDCSGLKGFVLGPAGAQADYS